MAGRAVSTRTSGKAAARPRRKAAAKARPLQWNEERRAIFLQTLATTSNVAASERAAGMAAGSAYPERRRTPEFEEAWGQALAEGYSRLELVLLERALAGVAKRTTKTEAGTVVEDYSDRLGMALLTAHRATVAGRRGDTVPVDVESAKQRLARKIEDMSRRLADG